MIDMALVGASVEALVGATISAQPRFAATAFAVSSVLPPPIPAMTSAPASSACAV